MGEITHAREDFKHGKESHKDKPAVDLADKESRNILLGDKQGKKDMPKTKEKADHLEPKNLYETMAGYLDSSQKSWSQQLDKEIKKNSASKDPLKQTLAVLQGITKAAVPTLLDSPKFACKIASDAVKEDQKDHGPFKAGTLANGVAADAIALANAAGDIGQGLAALGEGAKNVAKLAFDGTLGQKISDSWQKKNAGERAELATLVLLGAASDDPRKGKKVVDDLVGDAAEAGKKKLSDVFDEWGSMDELDKQARNIRQFPREMKEIGDAIKNSKFKDVVIDSIDDILPGGSESVIVDIPGDYMLKITKGRTGFDKLKGDEDWMLPIKDCEIDKVHAGKNNQEYQIYLQRKAEPISKHEIFSKVRDNTGKLVDKHPGLVEQYNSLMTKLKAEDRKFVDDNFSDQFGIYIDDKTNKPVLRFMDIGAVMTDLEMETWLQSGKRSSVLGK